MAISRELRNRIEKQDFDTIEAAWLDRLDSEPEDLDFFVGVARSLVGVAEDERARFLLEILDEALSDQGRWSARLDLLRGAGSLLLEPERIHPEILRSLEALYGDSPSFDGFVKAVRLHKAPHDVPKAWEKVDRFRELVTYDVGQTVWMEGKGPGRVVEVNLELDSLKVDFGGSTPLTVGFRAAPKMLTVLGEGHVLRRRLEEPEALTALAEESPTELLRITLESFGRPLSAGEVREALSGVVPERRWTSWWAAARKHPQVVAHGSGRHAYTWSASSEHAVEAVWERFEGAEPREKLALLRKEGDRDRDLARRMAESLVELANGAADADPGLAFEIACSLERDAAGLKLDGAPSPAELIGGADDPTAVLAGIADRSWKETAYGLLRETCERWVEVYAARLTREEDPRVLDLLADALEDEDPTSLWRWVDATTAQASRNPAAFTWIAERAAEDPALRSRKPLALLQQLFTALADKRFGPYRARLLPLVESGGTAPRLLDHLEERQAAKAEEAIHRAAGLEGYQRDALTAALHLRFPELRSDDGAHVIYSTREAIDARRKELEHLMRKELPENRKAIEEARALGDLRENFEYKSARQRHEYLSSRQAKLERELTLARPIDVENIDTSEVRIGTRVTLAGDGGDRVITILGPWDSKPEEDVLAYETDLAQALLGKKPGESVEAGERALEVRKIERYTD